MAKPNDRRDRRFDVRIPVTLHSLRGDVRGFTENASFRGLLMRTEQAPPGRHLVRLRLTVPTQAEDIPMSGMVVHVVAGGAGISSVGVAFYGLDGNPRAAWEKFIQSLQSPARSAGENKEATPARVPEARGLRTAFVVAVASVEALQRLVSRDIARGMLLIRAESPALVGQTVSVQLVHPTTKQTLLLAGKVRRRLEGGSFWIDLASMDASTRVRLSEFMKGDDEEFEVVDLASLVPPAPIHSRTRVPVIAPLGPPGRAPASTL